MPNLNNLIINFQNGINLKKRFIIIPHSIFCMRIINLLYKENLISSFFYKKVNNRKYLIVFLKYVDGCSIIKKIERISKPGKNIYLSYNTLNKNYSHNSFFILSTSLGILSILDTLTKYVGGEALLRIDI